MTGGGTIDPLAGIVDDLRRAGCVFAEEEARLLSEQASGADQLARYVARRVTGEPLEHVLGWVEFDGMRLVVGPGAFVPRQRSVFLAHLAAETARGYRSTRMLELCCGVGPISAVVAREMPRTRIVASDESESSLGYARANLPTAGVIRSDLFGSLSKDLRGQLDVIAAVPPYVPAGAAQQLPVDARLFDPPGALFGGDDGLDVVRRICDEARGWLRSSGQVLLEMHRSQASVASAYARARGFTSATEVHEDGQTVVIRLAVAEG